MAEQRVQKFNVGGQEYALEEYRNPMNGPHLRVTTPGINGAVMTRGMEHDSRPFWVGGYAIDKPSLRDAIASKVAELRDGRANSSSV